jgi:predicted nucleic acid-binding protein
MIFLDTGYLVALLDNRDELHERAAAWSLALREPTLVTEYVLIEVVNMLSSPDDRPRAHQLIGHLRNTPGHQIVPAGPALFEAGLKLHRDRSDKHWSLTDCISFQVMTTNQVTRALAFDHHFEQAGFEALLRRDPT